jgi:hypothetical protein
MFSDVILPSVRVMVLGLGLSIGLATSTRAEATVLSGRIEGSCHIEVDECPLSFTSDVRHDASTPIIAARVLANGVVIHEYRNDAINPTSDLEVPGRTVGGGNSTARCGQTYILVLQAQASDDAEFKSLASTRGIPCPVSVP